MIRQMPGILAALVTYVGGLTAGLTMRSDPASRTFGRVTTDEAASFTSLLSHNLPLLAVIAGGVITGGLLTLLLLLFNGMLAGDLLADASAEGNLAEAVSALAPHAPFEILALVLAGAVGFAPLSVVCRLALGRTVYTGTEFKDALTLLVAAALLMLPAAMLEAWVTPHVIDWTTTKGR